MVKEDYEKAGVHILIYDDFLIMTKEERENLIARPPSVSAAEPARLCRPSSPVNRVVVIPSSQTAVLLRKPPAACSFMPGVTAPVMPSASDMVISGTSTCVASREISSAAKSTTV